MDNLTLPSELISVVGSERTDFTVLAKRNQPGKKSIFFIVFGSAWTAFTGIFVVAFFGPLFIGKEVRFKSNGVPTTGSWDNFGPMVMPALLIGLFLIIGLALIYGGIYSLFQKGGYFVATNSRLIKYFKGNITTYPWEQFSGNLELNHSKGDITLQLRTGKMVSRENGPERFVPEVIYLSGVPDVLEIEKICRKRILENDPTPAITQ